MSSLTQDPCECCYTPATRVSTPACCRELVVRGQGAAHFPPKDQWPMLSHTYTPLAPRGQILTSCHLVCLDYVGVCWALPKRLYLWVCVLTEHRPNDQYPIGPHLSKSFLSACEIRGKKDPTKSGHKVASTDGLSWIKHVL